MTESRDRSLREEKNDEPAPVESATDTNCCRIPLSAGDGFSATVFGHLRSRSKVPPLVRSGYEHARFATVADFLAAPSDLVPARGRSRWLSKAGPPRSGRSRSLRLDDFGGANLAVKAKNFGCASCRNTPSIVQYQLMKS